MAEDLDVAIYQRLCPYLEVSSCRSLTWPNTMRWWGMTAQLLIPFIDSNGESVAELMHVLSKMLHKTHIIGSHLDVDISILVICPSIYLFHLYFVLFLLWNLYLIKRTQKADLFGTKLEINPLPLAHTGDHLQLSLLTKVCWAELSISQPICAHSPWLWNWDDILWTDVPKLNSSVFGWQSYRSHTENTCTPWFISSRRRQKGRRKTAFYFSSCLQGSCFRGVVGSSFHKNCHLSKFEGM